MTLLFLIIVIIIHSTNATVSTPSLKLKYGGCGWGCETGWYSSPLFFMHKSLGHNIIVNGLYGVNAINPFDNSTIWTVDDSSRIWPGIAYADNKIVVGKGGGKIFVIDEDGNLLHNTISQDSGEIRSIAVSNHMNPNEPDAYYIFGGETGDFLNTYAYTMNLTPLSNWPQRKSNTSGYSHGVYNDNIGIIDIDNDGYKDIVVPSDVHYICAYNFDGIPLLASSKYMKNNEIKVWGEVGIWVDEQYDIQGYGPCSPPYGNNVLNFRPNFANGPASIFQFDGEELIVVIGNVYNCTSKGYINQWNGPFLFTKSHERYVNIDHSIDWTQPPIWVGKPLSEDYTIIENIQANIAVGDLNNDGYPEFVFSSYDGKVHVFGILDAQNEPWNWPYSVYNSASDTYFIYSSEPVIVDIDNDGFFEVITCTWAAKSPGANGHLIILNYQGDLLHKIELPDTKRNGAINGCLAAPTVGYITDSGNLEILLNTVGSGLIMYEISNSINAWLTWPTGRGNFKRNGRMDPMIQYRGVVVTRSPTNSPTVMTDNPTNNPTENPITLTPSTMPTDYPTSTPIEPTETPTFGPNVAGVANILKPIWCLGMIVIMFV